MTETKTQPTRSGIARMAGWVRHRPQHWYPAACALVYGLLIALRIHGSSLGVYGGYLGIGNTARLFWSTPKSVRSDEWLISSQKTMIQLANGFAPINPLLGQGEDVRLLVDAPYLDWSILFKPQQWGFFVWPVEFAFAARWWWFLVITLIACYYFTLMILPKRYLLAALCSVFATATPLLIWWNGSAYAYFGYVCAMSLCMVGALRARRRLTVVLYGTGVAYLASMLVLLLYPPFLIPAVLVTLAFLVGYLWEERRELLSLWRFKVGAALVAVAIVGAVVGGALLRSKSAFDATVNTVYPGARVTTSGGQNVVHLAAGYLDFNLSYLKVAKKYAALPGVGTSQTDASGFIAVTLLILPLAVLCAVREWRRHRVVPMMLVIPLVWMLVLLVWSFVPGVPPVLGKLLLLDKIPHNRELMGYALGNFFLLVVLLKYLLAHRVVLPWRWAAGYAVAWCLAVAGHAYVVHRVTRGFVGPSLLVAAAICAGFVALLFARGRLTSALAVTAAYAVVSVAQVQPLNQGLATWLGDPLLKELASLPGGREAAFASDTLEVAHYPNMAGRRSITGSFSYPHIDLWRGLVGEAYSDSYNRYANITTTFAPGAPSSSMALKSYDRVVVSVNPCDPKLAATGVRYLVSQSATLDNETRCLTRVSRIPYPARTFHIYEVASALDPSMQAKVTPSTSSPSAPSTPQGG